MFVVHSTKKGFVHIPRTGGRFIESQCRLLDGFESMKPYHRSIPPELIDYEWHTRVRDPVERFVSIYRHNQSGAKMSRHGGNLDQFIESVSKGFEWHTRPQVDYITEKVICWTDIEECVTALGGTITGVPINQSVVPAPTLTDNHIKRIQNIYEKDFQLTNK